MDNQMNVAGVCAGDIPRDFDSRLAGVILLLANRNFDGVLEFVLILSGLVLSVTFIPAFVIVTLGTGNKPQVTRQDHGGRGAAGIERGS